MIVEYSISLWNYGHYAGDFTLDDALAGIREGGYGVELWRNWRGERDLFDEAERAGLPAALEGMRVTLHTAGAKDFESHVRQIAVAQDVGAELIVLHPPDLKDQGNEGVDRELGQRAVDHAAERGVRLALENGPLAFLAEAIEKIEGLGICLDVGHVYFQPESMREFLEVLKGRLIHLHIQDTLPVAEQAASLGRKDHYIPGTGGIPPEDWQLIARTLDEIDFDGLAVMEIQPRRPLQTALLARDFMQALLAGG